MFTKETLFMYSKKILFVDDTPMFIRLAQDFFRREQVEILTARNGAEAMAVARQERPDLIFMDLYMPGPDGDEICRELKKDFNLRSTPIVMVTSSNRPEDMRRCREAGCDDLVHKPMDREDFLNASRKFITFPQWSGKRAKISLPVNFTRGHGEPMTAVLRDLSVGGVFMETDEPLIIDTSLALEFRLKPDFPLISCKGRVAWLNREFNLRKNYTRPGAGLEFVDIKKIDLFHIQAMIKRVA